MSKSWVTTAWTFATSVLAVGALAVSFGGWMIRSASILERVLAGVAGLALLAADTRLDAFGLTLMLIARSQVRGGETRVFEAAGPSGLRFTMTEPGSALLLDDHRVIHETTPLQPDGGAGYRDTLVLTYRREGFLYPAA